MPILSGILMASAFLRFSDLPVSDLIAPMAQAGRAEAALAPEEDKLEQVLNALKLREKAIEEKEAQIAADEARLAEGRSALSTQLLEIQEADAELRRLLNMADTAAEDDLARLADIYKSMKPAEAGALFEQMPPAFAAGFLGLMEPAASASILSALRPETAFAVSVILAGRNVDAVEN